MNISDDLDAYDRIFVVIVFIAIILRFIILNTGIVNILDNFLTDDAFYYYSIARNVVMGEGVVFSSGNPTNGFHPLYLIILVPLFDLLYQYGINAPVYASLIILSVFTVGTSFFIYQVCKELVGGFAGIVGTIIWLFNPYIIKVSLAGTETPIQIFFISVLTWYLVSINFSEINNKNIVIIGALLGLIFLSRMDGVLMILSVVISLGSYWIGYSPSKIMNSIVEKDKRIYDLVKIGMIPSIVVFSWMGWSYMHVQRLTPVSGAALRLLRLNLNQNHFHWILSSIKGTINSIQNMIIFVEFDGVSVLVIILLTLVPLTVITIAISMEDIAENIKSIDFLIITFVLFLFFYWFITMAMRSWYTLFISFILTILVSISIGNTVKSISFRQDNIVKLLITIVIILSFVIGGFVQYDSSPEEPIRYQDASYIRQNIQTGVTIGSFNSGIRQYYTPNHTVVNLDGVVNVEAYRARSRGK
ncbi:MAG: glycosyltransferase family 39 protein, partial [Candidatus Paceibacteria bacterium]